MKDGRGNIAPSTIILPTLAMEAKRKAEKTGKLKKQESWKSRKVKKQES